VQILIVFNDPPYGSERVYNGLRLAHALVRKNPETKIKVFLMADAVLAARSRQQTPEGFYNIELMLRRVVSAGGTVLLCGSCMDSRGLPESGMIKGAVRSTMDALAEATLAATQVLTF
jgi:uncharacterized protein involved in oxidation of intracellular sulfur